jgi:hypothetical protein
LIVLFSPARVGAADGVGLTVYNQNFAVVREHRAMDLAGGRSTVRFDNVAATIVPESVQFRCLQPAGGAKVIEQNYEFDLVNADKLLTKYIDRGVSVVTREGEVLDGKLLSFDAGQLVLTNDDGVQLVPRGENIKDIRFSTLPEGLLTKPTLVWQIESQQAGPHDVEVAYRANNIVWQVDYRATADGDGSHVDLSGWVTVTNNTGATYADAHLKLMAGDVNVVEDEAEAMPAAVPMRALARRGKATTQFEEKSFAEYHLYTLPRPTTIRDKQTKQIELIDVTGIPVKRRYVYRGEGNKVAVMLEFKNAKTVHPDLGMPLPKGPIRVFQIDADRQAEFLGSDAIDHTSKDEPVKIRVGYAFDLTAERTQLDQRRPAQRVNEQDWRIRLRNHKDNAVKIEVIERLQGGANWTVPRESHPHEKKDFNTIVYTVDVPANSERVVTYTARYQW